MQAGWRREVNAILDALAKIAVRVHLRVLWRPRLKVASSAFECWRHEMRGRRFKGENEKK
jgi:hypothetical protein